MLLAAAVFLLAHLSLLPRSPDDIDAINFAMGVRDFDVARHQPHPPGYPVFVALAKVSSAAFRAAGVDAPEVRGLAVWSAIGGSVLLVAVFLFCRFLFQENLQPYVAMVLVGAAPLLWFTALRPLSDVSGLAAAFASLAALMAVANPPRDEWTPGRVRLLLAGAFMAGFSGGFRSQMIVLTLPLLAWVLVSRRTAMRAGLRGGAIACAAAGVLAWAVPLIIDSGGPGDYLQALGGQAGEDFSGVAMLWTHRSRQVALDAVLNTAMVPWDSALLAGIMLALAASGFLFCVLRDRRSALITTIVFGPYLLFHLLFQETVTTRYALPLVTAVAILSAVVLAQARAAAAAIGCAVLAASCLIQAVPAGLAFGRSQSPIIAAIAEMKVLAAHGGEPVVVMHRRVRSESRRARQWAGALPGLLLESPRDYEWLESVRAWRDGREEIWIVGDPRRTDLALIDDEYRRTREYRWPFDGAVYQGGSRPGELDWHIYDAPGWFLGRGWALTPEVAGITERDGWGPHRRPSEGWVRRREGEAVMVLGGRHLGNPGEPPAKITVAIGGERLASFEVQPGYFLEFLRLGSRQLAGDGRYAALAVTAEAVGPGAAPRVALEQFNLQSPDVVQFGFDDGWLETEYDTQTARSWRWMSPAASLLVHNAGRDIVISIAGESPLRYYDEPPAFRVVAGTTTLGEFRPESDFALDVTVPAAVLAASGGRVQLQSSESFVPADRDGSPDRRHLALRIYAVRVKATGP